MKQQFTHKLIFINLKTNFNNSANFEATFINKVFKQKEFPLGTSIIIIYVKKQPILPAKFLKISGIKNFSMT